MKVTTFVLCHKLEQFLDRAVGSIITQTRRPDRIVLVGSDCRSETSRAFEAWQRHDSAIETHQTDRPLSCPETKNAALSLCNTEAAFTLDADDYLHPYFVEKLMFLMEHGSDAVAGCDYTIIEANGQDRPSSANGTAISDILARNPLPSCSILLKSAWEAVGGYESMLYDDWSLWLKLWYAGFGMVRYPQPLFTYCRHPGTVTNLDNANQAMKEIAALIARLDHATPQPLQRRERTRVCEPLHVRP